MDKYKRFDKYFQYSYFNEINEKVGVFSNDISKDILREAKNIFDVIEYDEIKEKKLKKHKNY